MKFATVAAAVLPLASAAMYSKQEYESGVVMAEMRAEKEVRLIVLFTSEQFADPD